MTEILLRFAFVLPSRLFFFSPRPGVRNATADLLANARPEMGLINELSEPLPPAIATLLPESIPPSPPSAPQHGHKEWSAPAHPAPNAR